MFPGFHRVGNLQDKFESQAYEFVESQICEHYEIDDISDLTEEQLDELDAFSNTTDTEPYVDLTLRSLIDNAAL